ncbi:hypothetical protein FNH22_21980 [Fulvivirga sp. M361]|uniref:hypothetical protein n=1 Tax=Fulvivirga sp. M361 TaxID=2594266 RepID=UPI00117AFF31|nr:hypothetical protein [Fulvivirga sp. M361]TRX52384.1 hypothetical protein FNH22_21980 [Fulvivirga sp. M361]
MSKNSEEQIPVDKKLDAIKEIIFGDNIKAYESEFKQLKDHINKLQESNQKMWEEANQKHETDLQNLKNDVGASIKDLMNAIDKLTESTTAKADLSALLIELAEKLK